MRRNWSQQLVAWLLGHRARAKARRTSSRKRFDASRCGAIVEVLESRQLLTNLVAVSVSGGAVTLTDVSGKRITTGDSFNVAYNASQVVLTAKSGTMFQVGGQDQSTFTANVTAPISISMTLTSPGNSITVVGDGSATLSSFSANFSKSSGNNALTLASVIANSVTITGGHHSDMVTLQNCTVNNNLTANLDSRRNSSDSLNLQSTTVKGNVSDRADQFTANLSTITGTLKDVQNNKFSTFTAAGSTFTGAVSVSMGRDGTMNLNNSSSGQNQFQSSTTVTGKRRHEVTIFEQSNSTKFSVAPDLKHASITSVPSTVGTPTVTSQSGTGTSPTPTITGTYDATNAPKLTVAVNGTTYTLGTSSQLTATGKNWSLNLTGTPILTGATTVTATNSDNSGNSATGTGTITPDQSLIDAAKIAKYVTANSLTATTTADGLNYVVTTPGSGSIPTKGQTLTVNYSGFILNADGTQGTEFDSNVDAQFNHVSPFTFTLGNGSVIKGWDEAFALLPVGSVATLLIPSALAYGTAGSGANIPANSTLIFKVTLVSAK